MNTFIGSGLRLGGWSSERFRRRHPPEWTQSALIWQEAP